MKAGLERWLQAYNCKVSVWEALQAVKQVKAVQVELNGEDLLERAELSRWGGRRLQLVDAATAHVTALKVSRSRKFIHKIAIVVANNTSIASCQLRAKTLVTAVSVVPAIPCILSANLIASVGHISTHVGLPLHTSQSSTSWFGAKTMAGNGQAGIHSEQFGFVEILSSFELSPILVCSLRIDCFRVKLQLTYREATFHLQEMPRIRQALGLERIPFKRLLLGFLSLHGGFFSRQALLSFQRGKL